MDLGGCSIAPESLFICARIHVQRRPESMFNEARMFVQLEPESAFKWHQNWCSRGTRMGVQFRPEYAPGIKSL